MTLPRLWVVSELYYPEQTSTGYFLTHIAEGLAETMDVWVVCGQPTYSEHGMRAPAREERNGVRIHRVPATHFGKDRLALRAINVLTLSLSAAWFALTHFRRGDRLLIVTNPPTLPPLLGLIARWKRMDAHLLVHDVYPEVLAATGFLVCASALVVLVILGARDRDRFAPPSDLFDRVLASRTARVAIVVVWWWLGWHFLVAQTVDP